MREIKFRVYDTKDKKMISHFNGARIDYALTYWETHKHVSDPMQFTGLKDKNGVEIYDGDIVEIGKMVFQISVSSNHGYRFMWGEELLCAYHAYEGLVIGNIHENPELVGE